MYSGLQKAQLILSLLEDKAGVVLSKLSPSAATLLGGAMGDMPEQSEESLKPLLVEFHESLERVQKIPDDPFSIDFNEPMEATEFDISSEVEEALGESLKESQSDASDSDSNKGSKFFEKPDRVVELLREQKPQVAAFLYNRLEESVKKELEDHLSEEEAEAFDQGKIEEVPLSDRVFESMINSLKEESEREDDEQENSQDDSDDDLDAQDDGEPLSMSFMDDEPEGDADGLDMSLDDDGSDDSTVDSFESFSDDALFEQSSDESADSSMSSDSTEETLEDVASSEEDSLDSELPQDAGVSNKDKDEETDFETIDL